MFPQKRTTGVSGGGPLLMEMAGKLNAVVNKIDKKKGITTVAPISGADGKGTKRTSGGGGVVGASKMRDCRYCRRPFIMDRIQIHEVICQRSAKNKKSLKPFVDPFLRSEEKANSGGKTSNNKQDQLPSAPKWRDQHEALISSIKGAKDSYQKGEVAGGKNFSKLPPPPPAPLGGGPSQLPPSGDNNASNVNFIQCPHCGRRFSREAGDRHIPQCKYFNFNKPKKT